MRTIYIDSYNKCHTIDDGTMKPVQTDCFDGKCSTFVEGHCYEVKETGYAIYPWKPYGKLEPAQAQYERERLADAENALAILLGGEV